mgnify:CR=1 FL=1|jgi:hypothetical protein
MANLIGEGGRAVFGNVGKDLADYLGRKFGVLPEGEPAGIGHNNPPPEFKMPTALGALRRSPEDQAFFEEFDPNIYYHGTRGDFSEFNPAMLDLGVHVGTPEQANERLLDVARMKNEIPSYGDFESDSPPNIPQARVMPVRVNVHNPLRMPDVGNWKNSSKVIEELEKQQYQNSGINIDEIMQAYDDIAMSDPIGRYGDPDDWIESMENRELLEIINTEIQKAGYDGIVYKNIVETTSQGEGAILPEARAKIAEIKKEFLTINDAATARMEAARPPEAILPDADAQLAGGEAEKRVQAFLDYNVQNSPEDFKTPEELFRENQLMDLRDDLETQRYSPDSMIILNPEDIRSPNAAYDVDKRDSYDIMSDAGVLAGIQDTGIA